CRSYRRRPESGRFSRGLFRSCSLRGASLADADLTAADLSEANLEGAILHNADLRCAVFIDTNLSRADLEEAVIGQTTFGNIDLSQTYGLERLRYSFRSTVGMDTIYRSRGKIPDVFLRGCGLTDYEVEIAKLGNSYLTNEEVAAIGYKIIDLRATQ